MDTHWGVEFSGKVKRVADKGRERGGATGGRTVRKNYH